MFNTEDLHSEAFISAFKEELRELLIKYPTPTEFIREKYGVNNIMDNDYPSINNITDSNIIFDKARGNPVLSNKSVLTPTEETNLISEAISVKLK